jgi:hypothetical protein
MASCNILWHRRSWGIRGGAFIWGTVQRVERLRVRLLMGPLRFFIDIIQQHYGPGIDSNFKRNKYQEYLLGGKGGRCIGLTTLPPTCANSLEIVGASPSPSPKGLSRPVYGLLYKSSCVNMAIFYIHSKEHVYCLIFLYFSEESSYSKERNLLS